MQDFNRPTQTQRFPSRIFRNWITSYFTGPADEPLPFRRTAAAALRAVLYGLTAFLLAGGRSVSATHPFGLALLCAGSRGFTAFFGLTFSFLLGKTPLIELLTALLCLGCRIAAGWLLNGRKAALWREPLTVRMAIGTGGGFLIGLYRIVAGGFEKADLGCAIFLMAAIPASVFLFAGIREKRRTKAAVLYRQAARLTVLYALILALAAYSPFGLALNLTAALFFALCAAGRAGALPGCLAGLIGGLACGISYAPLIALAGLAGGLLKERGALFSAAAAVGVGTLFGLSTEGISAFLTTVPALLWGGTLYLPAARSGWSARLPLLVGETGLASGALSAVETEVGRKQEEDTRRQLSALSEALSSLSAVFYALSDRLASPGAETLSRVCEDACRHFCRNCRREGECWGKEYDLTADMLIKLAAAVSARNGDAGLPEELRDHCPRLPEITAEIRHRYAGILEDASRQNKTEIFALDYEALASLLASASEQNAERYRIDRDLTESARLAAEEMNLPAANVIVYGERRKTLLAGGSSLAGTRLSAAEIGRRFREACGMRFTVPEFRLENGFVTMSAVSAPVLACESARASRRKEKESVNGDSAVTFENHEGYFYSLISDGMGSGPDAAVTSRITCIFLEKLLSAGNRKSIVLKMLNHVIRNKNLECFSTVDLLEIDLLSGEASFIKSGAAPSYVLRAGKLFRLASRSLPIGITREITAEELRFRLLPGDLIVMTSDGISQNFEDGAWLVSLLSDESDGRTALQDLTKRILEMAVKRNSRSDDMTVAVIRVSDPEAQNGSGAGA